MGGKGKSTQRYLPDTAESLKKGDFNTPPVFSFFEKENGGLKLIFQNRRKVAILLFLAHNLQPPKQRFFYYPLLWWIELYQIELPVFIFGDDT